MSINVVKRDGISGLLITGGAVYDKTNHAEIADKGCIAVTYKREADAFGGCQSSSDGQIDDCL